MLTNHKRSIINSKIKKKKRALVWLVLMQLTILCKESIQPRQEQKGIQTGYSYLTMLSNSFAAFSFTALESSIFKCLRDECLLSHLVAKMKLIELVISQSCSEK